MADYYVDFEGNISQKKKKKKQNTVSDYSVDFNGNVRKNLIEAPEKMSPTPLTTFTSQQGTPNTSTTAPQMDRTNLQKQAEQNVAKQFGTYEVFAKKNRAGKVAATAEAANKISQTTYKKLIEEETNRLASGSEFYGITNEGYREYLDNFSRNAKDNKQKEWLETQKKNLEMLKDEKIRSKVEGFVYANKTSMHKNAGSLIYELSKQLKISYEQAESLYDTVEREQNAKHSQTMLEKADELTDKGLLGKAGAQLLSVGANMTSTLGFLESFLQNEMNTVLGKYEPLDTNNFAYMSGKVRDKIRGNIEADIEGDGDSILRKGLGILYQGATSSFDSLSQGLLLGPTGGLVAMASQAAGSSTEEAFERTGSNTKAFATGLTSGLIEAATEKMGLDNMWDILQNSGKAAMRSTLVNVLGQMVTEAGEEATSEVLNTIADRIINTTDSNWTQNKQSYIASGMTEKEAFNKTMSDTVKQVALAGAGGAAGGLFGGISSTMLSTNFTKNEQKVIDAEVEARVAEKAKDGKVSAKQKSDIRKAVESDLAKGYISIDTIEKTLGGDTLQKYNSLVEQEENLTKQLKELGEKPNTVANAKQYEELNTKLKELQEKGEKNTLKEQLSKEVSDLTENDRFLRESYNEKGRRSQAFEADVSRYQKNQQETIQRAIDSGILNNTNVTHEFVDWIAKVSADKDVSFDFTDNQKLKESGFAKEGVSVNGYVSDGNIVLNVNSAKSLNQVVGHEITHVLEGSELYAELQEAVKGYATTKGEYQSKLEALAKVYEGIEDVNVEQELTADLIGEYLFTDEAFVQQLSTQNRNVFQKIYDEIKYLMKTVTAGSKEARQLEKVKKVFEEAYRDNAKAEMNTDIQYSLVGQDENGIEIYETSEDIKPLSYAERKAKLLDTMRNEYAGRTAKFTKNGETYYAQYDRAGLKKGVYGDKKSSNEGYKTKITIGADGNYIELAENAIYKGTSTEQGKSSKFHSDAKTWDYFVKTIKSDGTYYNVLINVKDTGNEQYVYDITLREADSLPNQLRPNFGSSPASVGSISQNQQKATENQKFSLSEFKEKQLEIVLKNNKAENEYSTWIRDVDDIMTYEEALNSDDYIDYKGEDFDPSYPYSTAENALETDEIMVYSSYPIKQGIWVSPSFLEAQSYSGTGKVYSKKVRLTDVAWVDPTQGQYAKVTDHVGDDSDIRYSLSTNKNIDGMSEKEYNHHGWAKVNDVLTQQELADFQQKVGEKAKNGQNWYMNLEDGRYMFAVGQDGVNSTLIISDGDFQHPSIEKVYHIDADNETDIEVIRDEIYSREKKSKWSQSSNAVEKMLRDGLISEYRKSDFFTLRGLRGYDGGIGAESKGNTGDNGNLQNGRRSNRKTRIDFSVSNKVSSDDGIFFDGKNTDGWNVRGEDVALEDIGPVRKDIVKKEKTNLTVQQQIRNNIDRLNQMDNVAQITTEPNMGEWSKEKIVQWTLDNLSSTGYQIEREGYGTIVFGKKQIKQSMSYMKLEDMETYVHTLMPKVLKNGLEIEQRSNHKGREYGTKTFAAPVVVNGQRGIMAVVVKETTKNFYKVHRIVTPEGNVFKFGENNKTELPNDGGVAVASSLATSTSSASTDSISQSEENSTQNGKFKRSEYHRALVENMKSKFKEHGYDFDEVLTKAKDKSTLSSVDNTPQRFIQKTFGYKQGDILNDLTVNKVAQNETEAIRWLNGYTDKKSGILAQISKQYNIKPGSKESAAAQMYGEGFYVNKAGDYVKYGDAELAKDFIVPEVQENIRRLAKDPRIRQIYDDTLQQINESRRRNGYDEIPRRNDYFLHFQAMGDTFSRIGIPFDPDMIKANNLPTDLNGVTVDLKPGQPYFASSKQRKGVRTTYDLLGGVERYLGSAKNQIFHIDDIQNLRALRNYIADMYGQAKGLENLDNMSEEEAVERIRDVYKGHLSNFASFLTQEANTLAGKTILIDRAIEGLVGRKGISILNTINQQVGSNMVGGNVSSAATNFGSAVIAMAKGKKGAVVKSLAQTVTNRIGMLANHPLDNFTEENSLCVRRKGAEKFYQTPYDKIKNTGFALAGLTDDICTEFIARVKYNELIGQGVDERVAHYEADKWGAKILGDRSYGQQPLLFNSKMLGLVTKFQLEVRNNLDNMFYDTIQETKVENEDIQNQLRRNAVTAAKATATLLQLVVFNHLFGAGFEKVVGYNPTFDLAEIIMTLFGWDDEEESEDSVLDNTEQAFLALLDDLPYSSSFTGGRIPISSALPITEWINGTDQYGNKQSRVKTVAEALPYYILPTGYGQLKKSVQGLRMFDSDLSVTGSYTNNSLFDRLDKNSKKKEKKLRFPVEDTVGNRIKAGIFGQYANENAREYFDEERQPLSEKKTKEFAELDIPISEYWSIQDGMKNLTKIGEKADYIAGLELPVEKKNLLINNQTTRNDPIDLTDYSLYNDLDEMDFAIKNPGKYSIAKATGGYEAYKGYQKALNNIHANKDSNGNAISGSRKEKVIDYLNGLTVDYGTRMILYRQQFNGDSTYNQQIVKYLDSREDMSYSEKEKILTELGFTVEADGTVRWKK